MTTTDAITLNQVLQLARQLPRSQRAELIAQLARDLVTADAAPDSPSDGWERLNAFRAELAARYPDARIGDQLDRDRRDRQAMIEGHNVHV